MAKPRYTPGPWRYEEESPTRVIGPKGETVAAVYGSEVGDQEQVVANVRLIASAPAMYEYVAKRAGEGDQEAEAVLVGIVGTDP